MVYNLAILTFALIILTATTIYTNSDALECFSSKALDTCSKESDECLTDSSCSEELQKYNKCSFGQSEEQGSHVFNGYCFRRWEEKAQYTQSLIKCFRQTCNLGYNSEIGVKQLFICAQWVMLDSKFDCQDSCQSEMQKLGKDLFNLPLAELYGTPFENSQAQSVVDLIRKSCIEQGQGKLMIYQEQRLRQQRGSKKKNYRRQKQESQENNNESQL